MKRHLFNIARLIMWFWQLPQNLLGLIAWMIISYRKDSYRTGGNIILCRMKGGITLGEYIFISLKIKNIEQVMLHEKGHRDQSRILGPLYLVIIGLPSLMWACWGDSKKKGYYSFYTEKWANKLSKLDVDAFGKGVQQ